MMKETELAYMPGTLDSTVPNSPFWGSSGTWYGAYGYGGTAYTPGYMEEDTRVKTETTVFSAAPQPGEAGLERRLDHHQRPERGERGEVARPVAGDRPRQGRHPGEVAGGP